MVVTAATGVVSTSALRLFLSQRAAVAVAVILIGAVVEVVAAWRAPPNMLWAARDLSPHTLPTTVPLLLLLSCLIMSTLSTLTLAIVRKLSCPLVCRARPTMCWWLLGAAHPLVVAVVIIMAVIVIVVLLVVIIAVVGGGS